MTMNFAKGLVYQFLLLVTTWLKCCVEWLRRAFTAVHLWAAHPRIPSADVKGNSESDLWRSDASMRIYCTEGGAMVTVQTSTHAFHVDLRKLSDCSEYFRALSQSSMRETSENLVSLEHIPSAVFRSLLEFTFLQRFLVSEEDLGVHIQMGSYLLARPFTSRCLSALAGALNPENCRAYLDFSQEIGCLEMRDTVYDYLSRNLLELSQLTRGLGANVEKELVRLRSQGELRLCMLRKESLVSRGPDAAAAHHLHVLVGSDNDGHWHQEAELPFTADKWSFTTAVLYNYLYLIGGYRHMTKRGYQFKMASFRYNPFNHSWVSTAPLIKHRRHFSAAACEGYIFAVGGWYLDSLVGPDSTTVLYTAVERYDPWADTWAFVASLPLTDFHFTMSLSHDIPLTAALDHCIYVIGTIQRTGETLVLQYNVKKDTWAEMLPTLTRADAEIPSLYFLGATDRLYIIGGNNSENVVTSFCVGSLRWGRVRSAEKMALAGQGTVLGVDIYMPAVERNAIIRMNLHSLSVHELPPLPLSTSYEALFHLCFKQAPPGDPDALDTYPIKRHSLDGGQRPF
ncbi:kelch repeat and BTB domain-containing protein 11 [Scleropages formosus]|uniref:Kelch repeat and BTB domain-containing protein 11-like n=1 Tax=Scleropages formosus TaxID=113540 RepID=A0A8C9S5P5_SCLFO|nr:kelch repeat and BTB domain-containing protein 11-like [Scleropages formosus]